MRSENPSFLRQLGGMRVLIYDAFTCGHVVAIQNGDLTSKMRKHVCPASKSLRWPSRLPSEARREVLGSPLKSTFRLSKLLPLWADLSATGLADACHTPAAGNNFTADLATILSMARAYNGLAAHLLRRQQPKRGNPAPPV